MYTDQLAPVSNAEDWVVDCTLVDAATNEPMDITGYSFTVSVTYPSAPKTALVSATTTDGTVVLSDATAGEWYWSLDAETMSALEAGDYSVFVTLTSPIGERTQLVSGSMTVVEGGPS